MPYPTHIWAIFARCKNYAPFRSRFLHLQSIPHLLLQDQSCRRLFFRLRPNFLSSVCLFLLETLSSGSRSTALLSEQTFKLLHGSLPSDFLNAHLLPLVLASTI